MRKSREECEVKFVLKQDIPQERNISKMILKSWKQFRKHEKIIRHVLFTEGLK